MMRMRSSRSELKMRTTTRTHPEDEVEDEQQIFHALHPSLHFAHDAAKSVEIFDPKCFIFVCFMDLIVASVARTSARTLMRTCPVTARSSHVRMRTTSCLLHAPRTAHCGRVGGMRTSWGPSRTK